MGAGVIRGNVSIGRYCSIGKDVKIGLADHPLTNFTTHPLYTGKVIIDNNTSNILSDCKVEQFPEVQLSLMISDDVWIGDDVLIKKGIKVGQGAVIGANSVVTKDVPPYSIVVGSPAKVLKYRFTDEIIEKLIESEWYKISPENLSSIHPSSTIESFIEKISDFDRDFVPNFVQYQS
ncbi:CatB-related O-acetyltransferase [Psychrobacter immobilis]|uniref:CatB-related O-acetyltransferase n=1 Tax=Psychrobacter immobilis TaxID=498 RepID=UPI003FD32B6A